MLGYRVVVGDDDDDVRAALCEVLDADARFRVVGSVATGAELVSLVAMTCPDVVLLDVRMPGGGEGAARALTSAPDPPVVVAVSASTDVATVTALLRAGAQGYLGKGRGLGETLADTVARCLEGQVVLAVPNGRAVLRAIAAAGPDPDSVAGAGTSGRSTP
jgi:DNA-binding NarL/FixJ family response regulator